MELSVQSQGSGNSSVQTPTEWILNPGGVSQVEEWKETLPGKGHSLSKSVEV